jgi:hypothetical protein
MSNLCNAQAASQWGDNTTSGGGGTLGSAFQAAPAHPLTVGSVGFASNWPHELADEVMDQMADSIVELTSKLEEAEARVAVLEEEQKILKATIDGLRDALCSYKCADKASADGGWANI